MSWTDELRDQVKTMYLEMEPTAETTAECVKSVALEIGKTANAVRMQLQSQSVYVKQAVVASTKSTADKPKKVSKADSQAALTAIISAQGITVEDEIISKLTGKAAIYFTDVLTEITKATSEEG